MLTKQQKQTKIQKRRKKIKIKKVLSTFILNFGLSIFSVIQVYFANLKNVALKQT